MSRIKFHPFRFATEATTTLILTMIVTTPFRLDFWTAFLLIGLGQTVRLEFAE